MRIAADAAARFAHPTTGHRVARWAKVLPRKITGRIAMRFAKLAALAFGLALTVAAPAHAQYPNRPVTIMVSLAAGSGMDVLVRLYADKLTTILGKPVIVEDRKSTR